MKASGMMKVQIASLLKNKLDNISSVDQLIWMTDGD